MNEEMKESTDFHVDMNPGQDEEVKDKVEEPIRVEDIQPQIEENSPSKPKPTEHKDVPTEAIKSSDYAQPPEVKAYLDEFLTQPYNKHCIDCLGEIGFSGQRPSTHFLLWHGAFVCEQCAQKHMNLFGCEGVKKISDQWDDY